MIDRRGFLKVVAAGGAFALGAGRRLTGQDAPPAGSPPAPTPVPDPIPAPKSLELREIGKTGRRVPRLGLGTALLAHLEEDKALELLAHAYELGLRYFDTSPTYGEGSVESLLGRAFSGTAGGATKVSREELWLATRVDERKAEGTRRSIEASLKRLRTDHLDSVQFLAVRDRAIASENDSALDELRRLQEKQVVRHIGIVCNRSPTYGKRAIQRYGYSTALIPVNPADVERFSFLSEFLPFAMENKVGVIGMNIFVSSKSKDPDAAPLAVTRKECVAYALAQKLVDVIVPSIASIELLEEAHSVAAGFTPPSDEVLRDIEKRAAGSKSEESPAGEASDEE